MLAVMSSSICLNPVVPYNTVPRSCSQQSHAVSSCFLLFISVCTSVELASGDVRLVCAKKLEATGPESLVVFLIVLVGVCSFTPFSIVIRHHKQQAPHGE